MHSNTNTVDMKIRQPALLLLSCVSFHAHLYLQPHLHLHTEKFPAFSNFMMGCLDPFIHIIILSVCNPICKKQSLSCSDLSAKFWNADVWTSHYNTRELDVIVHAPGTHDHINVPFLWRTTCIWNMAKDRKLEQLQYNTIQCWKLL